MNTQKEKDEDLQSYKSEEKQSEKIETIDSKNKNLKKIQEKEHLDDINEGISENETEKNFDEELERKTNKKNTGKNKKIWIIILALFCLLIVLVVFSILNLNNKNIMKGIYINEIDVSNMSKEEAINTLNSIIQEKSKNGIVLSHKTITEENENTENNNQGVENETKTSFEDLEINYNISEAVDNAYNFGRLGNIFQNNFTIAKLLIKNKNININVNLNEENIDFLIKDISTNLPNKVIQSSYYLDEENSNLIITSGTNGDSVDQKEFRELLFATLNNLKDNNNYIKVPVKNIEPDQIDIDSIYNDVYKEPQNAYFVENPFKVYVEVQGISFDKEKAKEEISTFKEEYIIPLIVTQPEQTVKDLKINIFPDKLSSFTTKYDVSNKDRSTNLRLAAEKINGTILSPGETFSYNRTVGERSIQAGYKEAKVYSNGQVVDGIGGGICQISSTLYNAVIFANLEVKERHNHQFITSYVGAGRDATVVYGVKDFKFVNNRKYPIKIEMSVNNGIAAANIYGIKEDKEYNIDFDIENVSVLTPTVEYEEDSSVAQGVEKVKQKGSNGKVVKVFKVKRLNGVVVSRDFISQDTYNAMKKIIIRGTAQSTTVEPMQKEEIVNEYKENETNSQTNVVTENKEDENSLSNKNVEEQNNNVNE